jgi:hypothetical protein
MSSRPCVHIVRDMPVTDAKGVKPFATVDLRVFYPKTEGGFSGAVTALGIAYEKAKRELRARYEEFSDEPR